MNKSNKCKLCGCNTDNFLCDPCFDKVTKAQYQSLNKTFLEGINTEYFSLSTSIAAACLSKSKEILKILEEETNIGKLKIKFDEKDRQKTLDTLTKSAKIDVFTTYYHSIETLFRLFFAHMDVPQCPWIELASLTNFRKFKELIKKASENELDSQKGRISEAFLGTKKHNEKSFLSKDKFDLSTNNINNFLIYFANDLLKNVQYNSYKHGFAVFPGKSSISFGELISHRGDSIMSLVTDDKSIWNKEVIFFECDLKISLVVIAQRLIEQIIGIAKCRYLGEKKTTVLNFENVNLDNILKHAGQSEPGYHVGSFREQLWPPLFKQKDSK